EAGEPSGRVSGRLTRLLEGRALSAQPGGVTTNRRPIMRSTTTPRGVTPGGVLLLGAAAVTSLATPADATITCGGFTEAQAQALGYDTFVYSGQNQQVIN